MSDDYEIGYRRPPKGSRFKPGQSGNSRGRPGRARDQMDRAEIFRRIAAEEITLPTDAGPMRLNRCEALITRLTVMALNGNAGASRLLHELRKLPVPETEAPPLVFYISEDDAKL